MFAECSLNIHTPEAERVLCGGDEVEEGGGEEEALAGSEAAQKGLRAVEEVAELARAILMEPEGQPIFQ